MLGLRPQSPVPPVARGFALKPQPAAAGGFALKPQPPAAGGFFGASPPDPHWPPAAGGSAPRPPKHLPHCEFLATRLPQAILIFTRPNRCS